ncbi:MAG: hypothetical protein KDE56_19345, partial [Anaerolineales bacterium]|nr:hypothetical protein [Anaerolineales bacterium]
MASLEHFQDREEAIAAFDRLWQAENPWILAFTGFSGQGKSTLLDWLAAKRCQPQAMPFALIGVGTAAAVIGQAFHSFLEAPSLGGHLPREAMAAYRRERRAALDERNRRHMMLSQRQVMQDAAGGNQQMAANLEGAYREMEAQADEVILEAWLDCFEMLAERERVVLLLDNYDTFQDSVDLKMLQRFWGVLEQARGRVPGLRVVLVSREPLRHQNDLRLFHNGLAADDLPPLPEADSEMLLQSMGVTDGAYRQAVFVRLAQGHPLLTEMAANAWHEAEGVLSANAVPRLTSREEAVAWVQERILERLPEGALKEGVRWAALLRWFQAESLAAILGQTLTPDEFRRLVRYAFVIRPRV